MYGIFVISASLRKWQKLKIKIIIMKKLFFSLPLLMLLAGSVAAQQLKFNTDMYEKEWKEIQDLESQSLPKSAFEAVVKLLSKAKADNNPAQVVKCILKREEYQTQIEEKDNVNTFARIKAEIEQNPQPVKALLYSAAAQLLQQYYEQNLWRINHRTTTTNFVNDDIETWTTAQFIDEINKFYLASIQEEDLLQKMNIKDFEAVLQDGNEQSNILRPTLYDLLAHRVIDHFMNTQNTLTEAVYKYEMREDNLLSINGFLAQALESKDEYAYKLSALKVFQKLEKWHQNDATPAAYLDVLQKRLSFVYEHIINKDKDKLYLSAIDEVLTKYKSNPEVADFLFAKASYYFDKGNQYDGSNEALKYYLVDAVKICEQAEKSYPNSLGANKCTNLKNQIFAPQYNLSVERVSVPEKPILTLVNFKNTPKLFAKLLKINAKERIALEEININGYRDGNDPNRQTLDFLKKLNPYKQWDFTLPTTDDYRNHSTEVIIDTPLPLGEYILLTSDKADFSGGRTQITDITFSNISYVVREQKGEKEILILNRETGEPMKGVVAEIFTQEWSQKQQRNIHKKLGNAISNERGFMYPKIDKDKGYFLRFAYGKDTLSSQESYYNYRYYNNQKPYDNVTFFLDRSIYRPGQTVFFKGLALHFDEKKMPSILKNKSISVSFKDANWQEITHLEFTTNEYGTFSGQFVAPTTGLTGQMSLHSDIGGDITFRVEEYKRPKFETTFKPIEGNYRLNEDITVVGVAKAFAGNNIDNAKVRYRVVRNVSYPYWDSWCWWRPMPQKSGMEITNGTLETDANGTFSIKFKALPDESVDAKNKPTFAYTIYADVVDINGETHSAQTMVNVSSIALNVALDIDPQNNIKAFKNIKINATNLAGQKENITGSLKVTLLNSPKTLYKARLWTAPDMPSITESEFRKKFPDLPYKTEDQVQEWTTKREVLNIPINTKAQESIDISNKQWEAGNYAAILKTQDVYGNPIEVKNYFTIYDLKSDVVPANTPYFSVVEKLKYEPNDTAKIFVGTAGDKLKVLVELERDGKIQVSEWYNIKKLHHFDFKILESDRGNVHCHLTFVKNNRFYKMTHDIQVPWDNKALNIEYQSFRDKTQPGAGEEWRIKISGNKKEKIAAEMVAAMYDASLDQFVKHDWGFNPFPMSYPSIGFNHNWSFGTDASRTLLYEPPTAIDIENINYWELLQPNIYFGLIKGRRGESPIYMMVDGVRVQSSANARASGEVTVRGSRKEGAVYMVDGERVKSSAGLPPTQELDKDDMSGGGVSTSIAQPTIQPRKNLKETVFFMPNLMTDAEGNIIIKFTMNEALTKWKFLGFAHTPELKYALTQKEIITQKDLMVIPNAPRFMREGDTFEFSAKVSNLSDKTLSGNAKLELFDAVTNQPVDGIMSNIAQNQSFTAEASQSTRLAWMIKVPFGKINALTWRVTAQANEYSDGEENSLPILTNRMLVTETKPLSVRAGKTQTFSFDALKKASTSTTLQTEKLTLEFTQNPAWYAVQALPYLMEYPHECTEQIFSRYFANSLATGVTNAHPNIKSVFEKWKNEQPNALLSNLSKNQELKTALLEETPWVMDACNEAQQKQNIALLFDLNRMSNELASALKKLEARQEGSGGFAWFPGGKESWYITQYLVEGFGHLKKLNLSSSSASEKALIQKAIGFTDRAIIEHYNRLKIEVEKGRTKWEDDHLESICLHYLYARSFYKDMPLNDETQKIVTYYINQADKFWTNRSLYDQGLIALAMDRWKQGSAVPKIIRSLKERALENEEMGTYWKSEYGYYWNQLPIETHALMIEVFKDVAKDDNMVDGLKTWLLKNKQTNHWSSTKSTASAVYALLMSGDNWIKDTKDVNISFGGKPFDSSKIEKEAGTGYFKTDIIQRENTTANVSDFSNIKIENPNNVVAWGAMYWQYFEDLDKIKNFKETPLTIVKQLFKVENSDRGPVIQPITAATKLLPGDKINVRIEIRVDRNMEYVHLKDARASGFEPINVLSQYKWQGGLGYYESTKDAATNFFFDYLPKGTYVFEYPLFVNHKGDFSNGITTAQCMYAPEFSSHSEGIRVKVGE